MMQTLKICHYFVFSWGVLIFNRVHTPNTSCVYVTYKHIHRRQCMLSWLFKDPSPWTFLWQGRFCGRANNLWWWEISPNCYYFCFMNSFFIFNVRVYCVVYCTQYTCHTQTSINAYLGSLKPCGQFTWRENCYNSK